MPPFFAPLSGPVMQKFFNDFMNPMKSQFGLLNIQLGQSSAPEVEEQILNDVGSYGRQLGKMGDAVTVLLKHFNPQEPLSEEEQEAIFALKIMLRDFADITEQNNRRAVRP